VSRSLAGSSLVTAETRQKIDAAVKATGYVVNQAARNLREQRSRQVLVALPNIANPFYSDVVLGIEEAAAAGFAVLLANTANRQDGERKLARHFLTGAVDGLLLQTGRLPAELAGIADFGRKAIAVANRIPGSGITSVGIDEVSAAREAVAHLTSLGHRRIAHIGGPPNINTDDREKGYREALAAVRRRADDSLVRFGDNSIESGRLAALGLLAPDKRPTAIFCGNDEMAIGAIIAAKSLELNVPADLSIVGFDDIGIAAFYDPPITTVWQPRHEIGRTAMTELLALLKGKRVKVGRKLVLKHWLIVRQSTGVPLAG
jgi:LacI family transcriptional regulator, repressor for deo operon, udp, cdd, tsx, nupC, and nupG